MRLIDADAYKAEMKTRQDACAEWLDEAKADGNEEQYVRAEQALATFIEAKLTLDKMPTIEAEPIKHGKWITDYVDVGSHTGGVATATVTYCSACDEQFDWRTPYCPNCGAKMDEVNNG